MKLLDSVWKLVDEVCSDLQYVTIEVGKDYKLPHTEHVARNVKEYLQERQCRANPDLFPERLLYELIANSVNYCYWYGRADLRPNGASSTKMRQLLDESFVELEKERKKRTLIRQQEINFVIDNFGHKLISNRFPLLHSRIRHLKEIEAAGFLTSSLMHENVDPDLRSAEEWLLLIVHNLPGYAGDLFLKRAVLLIHELYRTCGAFAEDIKKFPIPADYQVPKMLNFMGCISYDPDLEARIRKGELIQEGSREEIEIRAASILACQIIADHAGCTSSDVDEFLWINRKCCKDPFHLTITTNY